MWNTRRTKSTTLKLKRMRKNSKCKRKHNLMRKEKYNNDEDHTGDKAYNEKLEQQYRESEYEY